MSDRLRILIVEDEPMLAFQLEDELVGAGHEIVGHAMSSGEALRLADTEAPDLVLLDVQLADGHTGVATARALASNPAMVLFLTASARSLPTDMAGALGVIDKPWSNRGLVDALAFLAKGHSTGVRPPPPTALRLAAHCSPGAEGLFRFA